MKITCNVALDTDFTSSNACRSLVGEGELCGAEFPWYSDYHNIYSHQEGNRNVEKKEGIHQVISN